MHCTWENLERETLWSQTLKNWRRWTHQNSTREGSMQRSGNFIFPVVDGTVKIFGRRTASENIHFNPGSSGTRRRTRNSSRKIRWITFSNPLQEDSTRDAEEAESDFWTITGEFIYRHHGEPESNCTCRKKKHFLIGWSTSTLPEQHIHHWTYCWIKNTEDYWNVDGEKRIVRCMDRLHKIHFIERKATWRIFMVRGGDLQGNKPRQDQTMARHVEAYVWCSEKESQTKMGCRETKARQCQTIERNILRWIKRRRIQAHNESRS